MNSWCESCARKWQCYSVDLRPRCYVAITSNDRMADRKTEPTGYNLLPVEDEPQKSCATCGYSTLTPSCDTCEGYSNWWSLEGEPQAEREGEWIEHKARTIVEDNNFIDFFPTEYECSNCGLRQSIYFINSTLPNFCPNCGSKMRKGADDE